MQLCCSLILRHIILTYFLCRYCITKSVFILLWFYYPPYIMQDIVRHDHTLEYEHDNLVSRPINQQTHQSLVSLSSASLPSAHNTRQIKSCYDNKPNNTHSRQKFTMSTWLYLDDHRGFYYKGAVYRLLSTANNDGRWCLFKPVRFTQWLLFYCYSCLLWYGTNTLYDDSW